MTAIGAGAWVVWSYLDNQHQSRLKEHQDQVAAHDKELAQEKVDARTRLLEAQKPFIDRQLSLSFDTANVVGKLASLDRSNQEWTNAYQRYQEFYWSEVSIVEDTSVESAMVNFHTALEAYHDDLRLPLSEVQLRATCLAHAIRRSIQDTWTIQLGGGEIPAEVLNRINANNPTGAPLGQKCETPVATK
jgi:hypothetical protein